MPRSNDWLASTFIGKPVRNSAGESLGVIEELVMDASGAITFGIVSFGGVAVGEKLIAIPWRAFGIMPGRDYVLLDVGKNVLQTGPSFDRRDWPDLQDPVWRDRIHQHYGYTEPIVERPVRTVVHQEYRAPRKEFSVGGTVVLILVLALLLGFTYLVATRGWQQAKNDVIGSLSGVSYAMKDASGDAALTAKVKTALSLNRRVPGGSINVDSSEGIVTLRGDVNDDQTRALAETIVQDTPGVREVHNHLFVMTPAR